MHQVLSFNLKTKLAGVSSKQASLAIVEDEKALWAAFKNGDENAFNSLYNLYIVQLYNYGERLTGDKELIEDSIHDFLVEIWKNRTTISQVDAVKAYLFKGFKNRLVKNLNKKRRFPFNRVSDDYQFEIVFSPEFDLITDQAVKDKKAKLLHTVNKLPPRQKEALTLKFYDELSYEQIALVMSLSVKSVYMLIFRAIDFLKKNLNKLVYICSSNFFVFLQTI
jgi:RNA polymerase sigma-70 factor (ECF subfamily)